MYKLKVRIFCQKRIKGDVREGTGYGVRGMGKKIYGERQQATGDRQNPQNCAVT
jgi:hypothetical protein